MTQSAATVVLNLIVNGLVRLFLMVAQGDEGLARAAALQALNNHNPRNDAELLVAAQIIAFGLASFASATRSMDPDVSDSMALRLRANATACTRAAERNRQALGVRLTEQTVQTAACPPPDLAREAAIVAGLTETQRRVAAAQAAAPTEAAIKAPAVTAAVPKSITSPMPAAKDEPMSPGEREYQAAWANAATTVAAEQAAKMPALGPAERKVAMLWTKVLADTADSLLIQRLPKEMPSAVLAALQAEVTPSGAPL